MVDCPDQRPRVAIDTRPDSNARSVKSTKRESMSKKIKLVQAGEEVARRLNITPLWKLGLTGEGARVAVVDSGIDREALKGKPPVFERDFTEESDTRDSPQPHGTIVANCIRFIAPKCDLLNAKVVPSRSSTSKKEVAESLRKLSEQELDVVNISLDFDADGCDPKRKEELKDWNGAIMVSRVADRESMCDLCLACWDLAVSGVVVVAAAGNRWGESTQCPGRSLGVMCAEATTTKAEWDYFYESKSRIRRWWDWKFTGSVGKHFGTSFSAGYLSGEMALLMPWIRSLGWDEASKRISGIVRKGTTTAVELHDALVMNSNECQIIDEALGLAHELGTLSGHLKALDLVGQIEPVNVTSGYRKNVSEYLIFLTEEVSVENSDAQKVLQMVNIKNIKSRWVEG